MKTYSDVQKERAENRRAEAEAERLRREVDREYLQEIEAANIPLHPGTADTERSRKTLRDAIRDKEHASSTLAGAPERVDDIICDHCETQLFYRQPNIVTIAGSRLVECPGCGWSGYL